MKAGALALLLTHLTAVIADVSTTTLLPEVEYGRTDGVRQQQRGSKSEGMMLSTVKWAATSPLFRSLGRTVRSSASSAPMLGDAGDQDVWGVGGDCEEETLEDVTVTDSLVSREVLKDKEDVIRLAQHLGVAGDSEGKARQLIVEAIEAHPAIRLMVLSVTTEELFFYKTGDQVSSSRRVVADSKNQGRGAHWTQPLKNCIVKTWVFGFSQPIKASKRKQITAYYSIEELELDVDQCQPHRVWGFAPRCDPVSTQCVSVPGLGFRPGGYLCPCRPGFYPLHQNVSSEPGSTLNGYSIGIESPQNRCSACPEKCLAPCQLPAECSATESGGLRTILLSVQIAFMSTTLALTIVVFVNRKCKTIASGMWTIIELILFGCIILYGTVLVRWFSPTTELCIIEPWCREIGFVICYGAIILKLYRILIEFRTRKAHRWVVRDKDLLKYLLGMIIVVFGYMAAWTATNLDMITKENYSIITLGHTNDGLSFLACKSVWWDYVTQTGELLILIFGVHLSYASRNAVSPYQERCFLCMAISVEALNSGVFYVLRFVYWDSMSPDVGLLAYFIRSHLTTTLVILLILIPKWYYHEDVTRSRASRHCLTQESGRAPFEAFKPQEGVTATGSDCEVEINLAEMNPDDIREELKRLYTQLEVLKNKTICYENPHISKRRGGRKIAHRRFSLQKRGSREKNLKNQSSRNKPRHEGEADGSRTPEDSVCSNEGPSIVLNDGPSEVPSTPKKNAK